MTMYDKTVEQSMINKPNKKFTLSHRESVYKNVRDCMKINKPKLFGHVAMEVRREKQVAELNCIYMF